MTTKRRCVKKSRRGIDMSGLSDKHNSDTMLRIKL